MKLKTLAVLLFSTLIAVSCKKEKTEPTETGGVYIAGYQADSATSRDQATFWKNGVATTNQLPGNNSYYALAIALSGNDVYTTGYENGNTSSPCQVWKNGQHQYSLGDAYSNHGNGIAVSGSDVYVAGSTSENIPGNSYAVIWKNSNPSILTSLNNSNGTGCYAIKFSGADVYAAGAVNGVAKLWKNGTEQPLTNPAIASANVAVVGIAIEGANVYVVGYGGGTFFRVWKNGTPTDISTTGEGYPTSIAVNGTDVYVGGYEKNAGKWVATYWKNGTAVNIGDPTRNSFVRGIAVKGTDIYAVGEQRDANDIAAYAAMWKNGTLEIIGKRRSRATAIEVK